MIEKIDHIGIAVKDLDADIWMYSNGLGLKFQRAEIFERYNGKIAFLHCGEVLIELLQSIWLGMKMDFIKKGGGIHHICYKVGDIEVCFKEMGRKFTLKDKMIKTGAGKSRIFFFDPSSFGNVKTEFAELSAKN